jgi:hypothetical protein
VRQQFAVAKALAGLDVPGEIQPVGADLVDRSAGQDHADSRGTCHPHLPQYL